MLALAEFSTDKMEGQPGCSSQEFSRSSLWFRYGSWQGHFPSNMHWSGGMQNHSPTSIFRCCFRGQGCLRDVSNVFHLSNGSSCKDGMGTFFLGEVQPPEDFFILECQVKPNLLPEVYYTFPLEGVADAFSAGHFILHNIVKPLRMPLPSPRGSPLYPGWHKWIEVGA